MKPLMSRTEDSGALKELGRASIQIVHDLKNQLNGLKLYATFLRKRLEKGERPTDELETVNKLIAGLDRAATDLSTITQYSREIEVNKQPGFDLRKVLRGICSELNTDSSQVVCDADEKDLTGTFDPSKLTDSLRWISLGVLKYQLNGDLPLTIKIARVDEGSNAKPSAIIEWVGSNPWDHDPFKSFAGTDEIRMSLAAKILESHDGSVAVEDKVIKVKLPLEG